MVEQRNIQLQVCTLLHTIATKTKQDSKQLRLILRMVISFSTGFSGADHSIEMVLKLIEIARLIVL